MSYLMFPPDTVTAKVYADSDTIPSSVLRTKKVIAMTGSGKTLTLPTPGRAYLGVSTNIVNTSSGLLTLSCTGGILGGNTCVVEAYSGVIVECIRYSTTYKWVITGQASALTGLSETIADTVGAMVSSNTETGIAVAYQDSDNTLDFTLAAGLGSSADWAAWAPTLTWATTAPAALTVVGRIRRIANAVEFYYDLSSADGEGKTLNSIALSTAPTDTNAEIPLTGHMLIDTTYTNPLAYVDAETDLCIKFHAGAAFTNAKAFRLCISGRYEVAAA